MLKLADGIAKLAAAAPWHCAQSLVVLGALAWMFKGQADPDVVIREVTHIYEKVGGAKPTAPQPTPSSHSSQKSPPSTV